MTQDERDTTLAAWLRARIPYQLELTLRAIRDGVGIRARLLAAVEESFTYRSAFGFNTRRLIEDGLVCLSPKDDLPVLTDMGHLVLASLDGARAVPEVVPTFVVTAAERAVVADQYATPTQKRRSTTQRRQDTILAGRRARG